jgi:sugar lactone lactonase YvrE
MRRRRLTAPAMAAALLVTSCSGGGADADPSPSASTIPSTPVVTTASPESPAPTSPPPTTAAPASAPTEPPTESEEQRLFTLASPDPVVSRSDVVRDQQFVAPGAVTVRDGIFHMLSGGFDRWPGESTLAYYTSLDGRSWNPAMDRPVLTSADIAVADPGTMGHTVTQNDLGVWMVFFHTAGGDGPGVIGRVTAPSPLGPWTADADPVLEPGPDGAWDAARLVRPQVVRGPDGFLMYYGGVDALGNERIGMASSVDGETWEKHDDPTTTDALFAESDPILVAEADWERPGVGRPAVTLSPDGFVMFYQGATDYGLAFSDDGVVWARHDDNPVVTPADAPSGAGSLYQASLLYRGGTYFLFAEAGNRQGADVYLLTHEGLLRDPATIGATVVETVVPLLEIATGGVTIDGEGNVYVADFGAAGGGGTELFRITPEGELSVFADDPLLVGASGNTVAPDGTVYQSSYSGGRIMKISPEGEVELLADEGVAGPVGLVYDGAGGLYAADCSAQAVLHIDADGTASPFAVSPLFRCPNGLTTDGNGTLYVANFTDGRVTAVDADGNVTTVAVVPGDNNGHLAYFEGDLYVVARGVHSVYKVTLDGEVTLIAGTGERGLQDGFALQATMSLPNGIAITPDGSMYINHVASVTGSANLTTTVRVIRTR